MSTEDKILKKYLEIRGDNIDNRSHKEEQFRFRKIVENNYNKYISKNSKILEIGCYKGYTLKEMKKFTNNENIYGIDLSINAVKFAKEYTKLENIYNEDAFNFLLDYENFFDVIIMKAVLEHIEKNKIESMINLIEKSLRKNGIALISVPNMDWIMANHERYMDFTHQVGFTIESLYDVMKLSFDDVKVVPMLYDFPITIKGKIRTKFITPLIKKIISIIFKSIGQGAYIPTMFDRSIIAICKK